jgi:hypothetical protein
MKKLIMSIILIVAAIGLFYLFLSNQSADEPTYENEKSGTITVGDSKLDRDEDAPQQPQVDVGSTESGASPETPLDRRNDMKELANAALYPHIRTPAPSARYTSNIEKALLGDANAQYEVSQALSRCSGVPREDRIQEIRKNRSHNDPAIGAIELHFSECSELHRLVDIREARNGKTEWLAEAALQGHSLALIRSRMFSGLDSMDDRQRIFSEGFELNNPDIFWLMTMYHSAYNPADELEASAWNFFVCSEDAICSTDEYIDNVVDGGYEYESTAIVSRIVEIREALDTEDWDAVVPSF